MVHPTLIKKNGRQGHIEFGAYLKAKGAPMMWYGLGELAVKEGYRRLEATADGIGAFPAESSAAGES